MEKISDDKEWILEGAMNILKAMNYDTSREIHRQFIERINSQYGTVLEYREKKVKKKKGRPPKL